MTRGLNGTKYDKINYITFETIMVMKHIGIEIPPTLAISK